MDIQKLPLIKVKGHVVFPSTRVVLEVSRTFPVAAAEDPREIGMRVFIVTQKESEQPGENIYKVGTIAEIERVSKLSSEKSRVVVRGVKRARIDSFSQNTLYAEVLAIDLEDESTEISEEDERVAIKLARTSFESYLRHLKIRSDDMPFIQTSQDLSEISYKIIANINTDVENKQLILEERNPVARLRSCVIIIQRELERLVVQKEVSVNVRQNVEKQQKEYYLREHLKVIKEQLGEKEQTDAEGYEEKIESLAANDEVKNKLNKELAKLKRLPNNAQEASVVREYLDLVLDLPWGDKTDENNDIKHSQQVLEDDHYGLTKIKERIVEFLAVRLKTNGLNAPILCLVGPPGVGKTSIAKSIAKALNRKYVRISLGGLHDEAEIRGHRKTYLGAMPGRIIGAIRQSKKDNPLILLDELDKVGMSHRGDPTSALLEVLDKEQNIAFRDNYVEVPYDISDVLFVCTANTLENIPPALKDRLDIIRLSSYTFQEKKQIAIKYLIKKQMEDHALDDTDLVIDDIALEELINYYTKEAGVRQLERQIESLCRKAVKEVMEKGSDKTQIFITQDNIKTYLGKRKFRLRKTNDEPEVGIVNGLAYTAHGGDTLSIEVNKAAGRGKLNLTGNIGKVMDESATAAFSFIRSNCEVLGIDQNFYRKLDMHIHIPEGATPKDGPSAGVTMATAMVSTLCDVPVKSDVAMTGEITIRGKVLPIGGLKEKVLAAKAAGIKTVLLPQDNESDLFEIEEYAKEGLDFVLVNDIHQVLEHALVHPPA
ncbi:MAG: endopeptidase La [Defluviitaleaceae bacterium]|nr:endopeptidase La [Defluviitaleaceae bacterium]